MSTSVATNQILNAQQITGVISTFQTPQSLFQNFLGCEPGGRAEESIPGNTAAWDIFEKTRTIAGGRAPGSGPSQITVNPIGHVSTSMYRTHEKIHLDYNNLFRTRQLGQDYSKLDKAGQTYVTKQEGFMAQRAKNAREFCLSRMFRGGFSVTRAGDDWFLGETSASGYSFNVDFFQGYTANTGKLTDFGGASTGDIIDDNWSNAGTNVIRQMLKLNAANELQHGRPLRHCWINSTVLAYLLDNTGLIAKGGTANVMWERFQPDGFKGPTGMPNTGFTVVFKGLPWLTFHIYDAVLEVGPQGSTTTTKFIDDTHAIFMPEPQPGDWYSFMVGSELVKENDQATPSEQFGLHAWAQGTTQPAGFDMLLVDNFIPALYVPKCVQYALIEF